MPVDGTKNDSCKLETPPNEPQHAPNLLLSLPLELREKIYAHTFASIHARRQTARFSYFRNELAILGTCRQFQQEASTVLFDRTPLRFIIGHLQSLSSRNPPQQIVDRFQNVSFQIVRMSSTHPCYEFHNVFDRLTKALTLSSTSSSPPRPSILRPRKSCYLHCELEEYAGGHSADYLRGGLNSFTAFETVTIDFAGKVMRSDFPLPAIADDDPDRKSKVLLQEYREGTRRRESAALADVGKMIGLLEGYLGEGRMLDLVGGKEGEEALYARRIEFYPLRSKNGNNNNNNSSSSSSTIQSHEDA